MAGSVYLIDSVGDTVLTDYDRYSNVFTMIVLLPAIAGEAALTFWLLRQGRTAGPAGQVPEVTGEAQPNPLPAVT